MQHPELTFVAEIPEGYENCNMCIAPGNTIIITHPTQPVLYLDEKAMVWRELDRHISEVGKDA